MYRAAAALLLLGGSAALSVGTKAHEVLGVRCVATLENGPLLIVHMSQFSQAECVAALEKCAEGRSYGDPHYFDHVVPTPASPAGQPDPEICQLDANGTAVLIPHVGLAPRN